MQAELALLRKRQAASLHLTNNANCLQAQLALPRERQAVSLLLTNNANRVQAQPACRKVLKLSQERLTIKAFRPLRRTAKDAVFGNCHLLEKVDENFIVIERERPKGSRPARERQAASLHLANNANCLQAQLAYFSW